MTKLATLWPTFRRTIMYWHYGYYHHYSLLVCVSGHAAMWQPLLLQIRWRKRVHQDIATFRSCGKCKCGYCDWITPDPATSLLVKHIIYSITSGDTDAVRTWVDFLSCLEGGLAVSRQWRRSLQALCLLRFRSETVDRSFVSSVRTVRLTVSCKHL